MSGFIDFIKEYKEVLTSALAVLLTLILIFIKRRPKTIDDFLLVLAEVTSSLPTLINKVECAGHGLMKKKEVRSSAVSIIEKKLGRKLSDTELDYSLKSIDSSIEAILSTPQKKDI